MRLEVRRDRRETEARVVLGEVVSAIADAEADIAFEARTGLCAEVAVDLRDGAADGEIDVRVHEERSADRDVHREEVLSEHDRLPADDLLFPVFTIVLRETRDVADAVDVESNVEARAVMRRGRELRAQHGGSAM